jgi:hypothetical protein
MPHALHQKKPYITLIQTVETPSPTPSKQRLEIK